MHKPIIGRLTCRLPTLVVMRDRVMPYDSRTEVSAVGAGKMRLTDAQAYW